MPYIDPNRRVELWQKELPKTAGELNYMLSAICWKYFKATGNYQGINDIVGALEGAKLEFYRRVASPYEDRKIIENGDVYV